jgi:ubiquinone/menaquinone biosynthesis C-methylase UbiE
MNEDLKRWDEIADAWVNDVIPKGKISEYLTKPALNELLGNVQDKTVLDAGCGNGRFTNFLSTAGARATGIDGSSKMVEYARKTFPDIPFEVADLNSKLPFENNAYDAVICDAVLMSIADCSNFLLEANRVLKEDGALIVSVLHPAFNHPTTKLYRSFLNKILFHKVKGLVDNYYQTKTVRRDDNATAGLNFYHRTIEQYVESFRKAGFLVERILEPRITDEQYLKDNPEIEYAARMPRFIFFKLVKQ